MKRIPNSQRVVLDSFKTNYELTRDELLKQFAKNSVEASINLSVLPKQEAGKTTIIMCRNKRSEVKKAKKYYKNSLTFGNRTAERDGMIHQIVQFRNPRMNLKVIVLN